MAHIRLYSSDDVDAVFEALARGEEVQVEVGFEEGPSGLEPRVELLQMLLDRAVHNDVSRQCREPHPQLRRKYLRSCVVHPPTDPGESFDRATPLPQPPSLEGSIHLPLP